MNDDGATYEIACIFSGRETDKAVLIIDPASGEELWIPLSQVIEMHGREDGKKSTGRIVMTEWIAKKKGLC